MYLNDGSCIRLRPQYPNHVWAYAFMMDRAQDVIDARADLFVNRGPPAPIRSENGPELCSKAVRDWLEHLDVGPLFIKPGNPWENGYNESFDGKLRAELLNREIFYTLGEDLSAEPRMSEVNAESSRYGISNT